MIELKTYAHEVIHSGVYQPTLYINYYIHKDGTLEIQSVDMFEGTTFRTWFEVPTSSFNKHEMQLLEEILSNGLQNRDH
jgi:hypothetical protein